MGRRKRRPKKVCETRVFEHVNEMIEVDGWKLTAEHGYSPKWCINEATGRKLPFDIIVHAVRDTESKCIIIEVDGAHHFRYVRRWHSKVSDQRHRDIVKMIKCIDYEHYMIRVVQDETVKGQHQWKSDILTCIQHCLSDSQLPDRVHSVNIGPAALLFIGDSYQKHIDALTSTLFPK